MNVKQIETILNQAVKELFVSQPDIFDYTSATGQTEWNLAHHLAVEVIKHFPGYRSDLDVTKHDFNNRRPDIIVHKRGNHTDNLLVIEVKFNGSDTKLNNDVAKIKNSWFEHPLRYHFGAVVDLRSDFSSEVRAFENEQIRP